MILAKTTLAATLFLFSAVGFAQKVDISKSTATWLGSKPIGTEHTGEIKIKSADLKFSKNVLSSAKVVIDMTSITNKDLTDPKWNKKLVGHLKSDDFFSVDKYKTSELTINKVSKTSDKTYLLKGDLKIKGKKQPVSVKADIIKDNKKNQTVKAVLNFDRAKFDIKFGSGSFFSNLGDKLISDDVSVTVELHIIK